MITQEKIIVLFGCGGHSRSVADVILANGPNTALLFVDSNAKENEMIYGFPVIKEVLGNEHKSIVAIGDNKSRKEYLKQLGNIDLISVVSDKAYISNLAQLSAGCFVGNFSHIGPGAIIGMNTIINNSAVIEHEVHIGEHCHVGPNAIISGRCRIGELVFVGVGATIKDYINVCSDVTIGAGATVVKDINEPGVYVGTPAIRIK